MVAGTGFNAVAVAGMALDGAPLTGATVTPVAACVVPDGPQIFTGVVNGLAFAGMALEMLGDAAVTGVTVTPQSADAWPDCPPTTPVPPDLAAVTALNFGVPGGVLPDAAARTCVTVVGRCWPPDCCARAGTAATVAIAPAARASDPPMIHLGLFRMLPFLS